MGSLLLRLLPIGSPIMQQAARMLYRLSKESTNDARFRLGGLLRPIVGAINLHTTSLSCSAHGGSFSTMASSSGATCTPAHRNGSGGAHHEWEGRASVGILMYLAATLKNISTDAANQKALARAGAVSCFGQLLLGLCTDGGQLAAARQQQQQHQQQPPQQQQGNGGEARVQLAVQAAAALRNLALDPSHAPLFVKGSHLHSSRGSRPGTACADGAAGSSDGAPGIACVASCLTALLQTAAAHPAEAELLLNVSRCLSKLSMHPCCLEQLEAEPGTLLLLMRLAERHSCCAPLLLRLAFVLGNATTHSAGARGVLAGDPWVRAAMLQLLRRQVDKILAARSCSQQQQQCTCSRRRLLPSTCVGRDGLQQAVLAGPAAAVPAPGVAPAAAAGGVSSKAEAEEACVKLLRLLANMAMEEPAGRWLAAQGETTALLGSLLRCCSFEESGELVLNATAAVSNLAYYQEYEGLQNKVWRSVCASSIVSCGCMGLQ